MEVKQISNIVNSAITDSLGGAEISLSEDLSNVVDVGVSFDNLVKTTTNLYEKFTGSLVNQIGRIIVSDRVYTGRAPSVLMDSWEYGSILEKIGSEMPTVTTNSSWELTDGTSYDPHVFHTSKAYAKFFNKRTTFEIDKSIVDRQIRQSFQSATQLNAFISMMFNEVEKALTVATENLIRLTVNNFTANVISAKATKPACAINLYEGFKKRRPTSTVPFEEILEYDEFIRYAVYVMNIYRQKMSSLTTMFNLGGKQRFTPEDSLHIITLSDFMEAADVYLQSSTYHDEYTRLKGGDIIPYWQSPGTDYSTNAASTIKVTPIKDDNTAGEEVNQSGILSVMFDRNALGVCNFDRRVTTAYNPKAEFTNYFYKQDAQYFNDTNEQFIVFYVENTDA